ncbi:MAG: protein kinase [Acidobacteria bacterium]|nr:protein kinase [Acidobacteriota bacterium]
MMDKRWEKIEEVFQSARELAGEARVRFIDDACGSDIAMRREVERLLNQDENAQSFLDKTEAPAFGLEPGTKLGGYEIRGPIGAGGMGEVYSAHDERLDRDVAIKVLPARTFSDPGARARLLREARAAAALNHPNVCTIHEVGEADGHVYIAMELVTGQPLDQLIPAGGMPADEVLRYGLQIADAAAHAHEQGILHRDLKPANILLTRQGRVKVLDFGLAKRTRRHDLASATTASQTEAGALIGTLPYMAPEQLRGEAADTRSDVWALGVTLYEMASGSPPFEGQTGFELSAAILNVPPPALAEKVPQELQAVISHCLEKDPERRYQRAGEVHAALEAILAVASRKPAFRLPWNRPSRLVLASVIAVAAMGLGWWAIQTARVSVPRIASIAVLPLENLSGDSEQEYFAAGMHEALITELSKISALTVKSTLRYRAEGKSLPQIAGELDVDALVEGSVALEGDQVRISVRLLHVPTDRHLWADSYEREMRGVLALQKQVARAIAEQIQVTVTPQEAERLATARAVDPAAYDAWARGLAQYNRLTADSLRKCLEYAEAALAVDPNYAPAHALSAACYSGLPNISSFSPAEAAAKAKAAARRALDLDETLAEAHFALAWTLANYDWDWARAEREYRLGLELNPNSALGHSRFGWFLSWLGRDDEAVVEVTRGVQLNPVGLREIQNAAVVYYVVRQYDKAVAAAKKATDIEPSFAFGYQRLGMAYTEKGLYAEAIAALEMAAKLSNTGLGALGRIYALAGRHDDARRILKELMNPLRPIQVAMVYTALEERDEALRWLEEAHRIRDANLVLLKVFPAWDPLRNDPRFQDLLRRMKFPES